MILREHARAWETLVMSGLRRASRAPFNMWKYWGLIVPLITVSGEDIKAAVGEDKLLPCPCPNRILSRRFTWQINESSLVYDQHAFHGSYENRASVFVNKDEYNCSLLLKNISLADEGTYKCDFFRPLYHYAVSKLSVYANYTICQSPTRINGGKSTTHCDATGGYPEAQIQWKLDGKLLKTPSRRDTHSQSHSTGLYHLSSNLTIDVDSPDANATIQCVLDKPALTGERICSATDTEQIKTSSNNQSVGVTTTIIIIIIAVLVVSSLALYYQRSKKNTERRIMEATMCRLMDLQMSNHNVPVEVTTEE